jgi:hypothetical protein
VESKIERASNPRIKTDVKTLASTAALFLTA